MDNLFKTQEIHCWLNITIVGNFIALSTTYPPDFELITWCL